MLRVGVVGFGGGSALIPVMEQELVKPGALTAAEFVQDTVIANITPGALPVKLAALSGARLSGTRVALSGAAAVALPGAVATVAMLALFAQLGPDTVRTVEYASLGVTAFILYLLAHYVLKVVAPGGRIRAVPVVIAVLAFVFSGAGKTVELTENVSNVDMHVSVPELSALGLVLLALTAIAAYSLWQFFRRHEHDDQDLDAPRSGQTRRAIRAVAVFLALGGAAFIVSVMIPPAAGTAGFLSLTLVSTVTSFGGGEAYVGVADGFFVASGLVDSAVFYGQIVPIANALPGPILIKIATGIAYVVGGGAGFLLAGAVFVLAVCVCGALAVGVLAGYDRARNSRLVRNVSVFILPVICGLLASTSISMLNSNVRIAEEAGVPGIITVGGSVALAALVPLAHRFARVPDIVVILTYAAVTCFILTVI